MKPVGARVGRIDADVQPLASGRRIADGQIAAGRHQGAANAEIRQDRERRVGGVALTDASEIQAHARLIERDRPGGGVQMELAISRVLQGVAERGGLGEAMLPAGLSPQQGDRAERHVEGAAGLFGQRAGGGEHGEEVRAHVYGLPHGGEAEVVYFAIRAIVRHGGIQLRDALEGGAECGIRAAGVRGVQLDANQRSHVRLDGLE